MYAKQMLRETNVRETSAGKKLFDLAVVNQMPENDEPPREKQISQLVHDAHGCLHAIGMGIEILKAARGDEERFLEVCSSIAVERRKTAKLLDELQRIANR